MGKYTWAYINTTAEATATAAAGVSGSIQFKGESARFDGDANLTFDQGRNQLQLTGTLDVQGTVTARDYQIERVTVAHRTGPTSFGDSADDTHAFTGDITVSDALTVTGLTTLNEAVDINKSTSGIALDVDSDQNDVVISAKTTATSPTQGIVHVDTEALTHANAVGLWVGDKSGTSVGSRLGGATLAKFYSFSNNTTARDLMHIHNRSSAATAAQGLVIENAADPTGANRDLVVKGGSMRFQVDHEGVIIGPTTTSAGKLHVYSSDTDGIGAIIKINDGNSNANLRDPQIQFANDANTKFTIGSDGDDGMKFKIGTTTIGTNVFLEANTSGEITKIGDDTPASNDVLTWNGSKAVWTPASDSVTGVENISGDVNIKSSANINNYLDTDDGADNEFRVVNSDGQKILTIAENKGYNGGHAHFASTSGSSDWPFRMVLTSENDGSHRASDLRFIKIPTDGTLDAGDWLGTIQFLGDENGTGAYSEGHLGARIQVQVAAGTHAEDAGAEDWIDTSQLGSEMKFQVSTNGTTTITDRLIVDSLGIVVNGRIFGPPDDHFVLKSDKSIVFHLDEDNDTADSAFRVYSGGNDSRFEVDENGKVGINLAGAGGDAAEKLHIRNTGAAVRTRMQTEDGYDVAYTGYQGNTQKMAFTYNDSDDRIVLTYGPASNKYMTMGPTGDSKMQRTGGAIDDYLPVLDLLGNSSWSANSGILRIRNDDGSVENSDTMIRAEMLNDPSIGSDQWWLACWTEDPSNAASRVFVGGIHSEILFGTFTGTHPTKIDSDDLSVIKRGMIVKSTGEIFYRDGGISNAWCKTKATTAAKDKAAVGVYNLSTSVGMTEQELEQNGHTPENHMFNAVGEGQILVTDEGGNIETGDYICSSNRLGHGMLQDDDILHNYTVAKATEPIDFSTIDVDPELGFKSVLVACTYHCG